MEKLQKTMSTFDLSDGPNKDAELDFKGGLSDWIRNKSEKEELKT